MMWNEFQDPSRTKKEGADSMLPFLLFFSEREIEEYMNVYISGMLQWV